MEEVLLPIGTIVNIKIGNQDEPRDYMIIGNRIINHESFKCWDYVAVPYPEGMKRTFIKKPDRVNHEENFVYFNHPEIDGLIKEFK